MAKAQKLEGAVKARKRWFDILATKNFNESIIGETPAISPELIIGRTITCNLMNLTGNIKKQNINVKFRITSIKDNKFGVTEIIGYEMMPAMIKRLVRRGRDKIDDSFIVKSSDGKFVRVKPLLITGGKISRDRIARIRKDVKYFTVKSASENTFFDFVSEVLTGKFQNDLGNFLRKDYPLRICEIRAFVVIETVKKIRVEKAVKEELAEEESDEEKESEFEEQKIIDSVKKKEEPSSEWASAIENSDIAPLEPSEEKPPRSKKRQ